VTLLVTEVTDTGTVPDMPAGTSRVIEVDVSLTNDPEDTVTADPPVPNITE
jgi:hypothetical protein